MHHRTQPPTLLTVLRNLLLALAVICVPLLRPALPARAQVAGGSGFASAVPCLSSPPTYATTTMANTIVAGGTPQAAASDPALLQLTSTSAAALVPLGASSVAGQNTTVANGIGATYGLAYDDGSISGVRRLFAAAYLKRSVAFGSGGPGAIYEYRFATGTWGLATTVPGAWSGAGRTPGDSSDTAIFDQVGKQGLGDLEVSPDGRTLYAMNLTSRQIERYDISGGTPARQAPLAIPYGLISSDPAVLADLRPFALGFYPLANLQGSSRAPLVVGIVDSAERSPLKNSGPWIYPKAYVLGYNTGTDGWGFAVQQNLVQPDMALREALTTYFPRPALPGYEQTSGWNPWRADKATLQNSGPAANGVRFPQPLLTDITFSQDGQRMYMGLRDRSGDQFFAKNPPPGERVVMSQGDVLTYQLVGGAWQLQGNRFGDVFDDNTHAYPGSTPAHIENLMGSLAISMVGSGPSGLSEQVLGTSLLGASTSGVRGYAASGGGITSQQTLNPASAPAGGKAAGLGDVEVLCSYALVGGQVWQDTNGNGIQDTGEPALPGVAVEVFQGSGASVPALASLSSDAQGRYLFAVPPNTPVDIRIAASSRASLAAQGWHLTLPNLGGNDASDSDISDIYGYIELSGQNYGTIGGGVTGIAIPLPLNRSDQRDLDIGLTKVQPVGELGDLVWDDLDHDGVQDAGEPGHAGIAVSLTPDPQGMTLLPGSYPKSLTTNASGRYLFGNLPPGRYTVGFGPPAAPFSATLRNQGGNDALDSDADASTGYRSPLVTIAAPPAHRVLSTDLGLFGGTPDVWITKSGPPQALVGQTFSYTLDYGNAGALAAAGVQLVDTLPAGLTYVSASPSPSSVSGQTLTWSLGTLAIGQTGQISLSVRAPASVGAATSQVVANTASISTSTPYDPTGNNSSTSSGAIVRPEVSISKSAPASVLVGDEFSYTLSYANTGSIAAASVSLADTLPAGVAFTRFIQNPSAACSYTAATRRVSCAFSSLAAGASGSVVFAARADATAAASVANTATISTATAGDSAANNSATATTAVQFPNPGVSVAISPSPFPLGDLGTITLTYRNSGTGVSRSTSIASTIQVSIPLGTLPSGCAITSTTSTIRVVTCSLGDLNPGATGTRVLPISLPSSYSFPLDQIDVSSVIGTITPERTADQADDTAIDTTQVVRPNVFVTASGPDTAARVAWGSAFAYDIGYGDIYRAKPTQTRAAQNSVLRVTLPSDVTFLTASVAPSAIVGQVLTWNLNTLNPQQMGSLRVAVKTSVPAGTVLTMAAQISTTSVGDDPSDNAATVTTTVVPPPASIPEPTSDMRLAIRSTLDPNSNDTNPTNGVYVSSGPNIAWPAGEVLDFTPRLTSFDLPDPGWPFEHRARLVGWDIESFEVNGRAIDPKAADARGVVNCRAGATPSITPQALAGCAYAYVGASTTGRQPSDFLPTAALLESDLNTQAHAYWTQPPTPPMRSDVYLYTVDPLTPIKMTLAVEVEVWVVNSCPDFLLDPMAPCAGTEQEMPVPGRKRQLVTQIFTITLLVPRSVIGPGDSSSTTTRP